MFPADVIGGSSKDTAAQREVAVDWGGSVAVQTDLDETKKFFRKRGWVRDFFQRNGITAGDIVMVEETARYNYRVRLQQNHR
jgi:DNA polymerase-3 subunit epsilon